MNTLDTLVILGASDPEMEMIERLAVEAGLSIAYASVGGRRCHPGNAYKATDWLLAPHSAPVPSGDDEGALIFGRVVLIECDAPVSELHSITRIDHHRPGDPGWGVGPEDFLRASSLGQFIAFLAANNLLPSSFTRSPQTGWELLRGAIARRHDSERPIRVMGPWDVGDVNDIPRQIPQEYVLCAAADHCLAAAHRGQCPGVDPDELMLWRVRVHARHQGRSEHDVLADIERARFSLRYAPSIAVAEPCDNSDEHHWLCQWHCGCCGVKLVADLRGQEIPELPDAAAREGIAFLATPRPGPDGRQKVVLQCADEKQLAAWQTWAHAQGLVDLYGGDPARGFAGGYKDGEKGENKK